MVEEHCANCRDVAELRGEATLLFMTKTTFLNHINILLDSNVRINPRPTLLQIFCLFKHLHLLIKLDSSIIIGYFC